MTKYIDTSFSKRRTIPLATVAEMKAAPYLEIGQYVETGEYFSGSGGGNRYQIVAAGTGTDDGGSYIDLTGIVGQAKALWYNEVIDVKHFGAVGDGVTDDQAAIDTAILALPAGGTLLFPASSTAYMHSTIIGMKSDMRIVGYGATVKALSSADAGQYGFQITDPTLVLGVKNVIIEGLTYDGNRAARTGSGSGAGFYMSAAYNITLRDCTALNCTTEGLQAAGDTSFAATESGTDGRSEHIRWINCRSDNANRNGASLTGCTNFVDVGGVYNNTNNSGNPGAGVDVEPNGATSANEDCYWYGITTNGNKIGFTFATGTNIERCRIFGLRASNNTTWGYQCGPDGSKDVGAVDVTGTGNTTALFDKSVFSYDQLQIKKGVIQVETSSSSSSTTQTTISTYLNITGATVTITPEYANSNVMVSFDLDAFIGVTSGTEVQGFFRIVEDPTGTPVQVGDTVQIGVKAAGNGANALEHRSGVSITARDAAPTAGTAITYGVQMQYTVGTTIIGRNAVGTVTEISIN